MQLKSQRRKLRAKMLRLRVQRSRPLSRRKATAMRAAVALRYTWRTRPRQVFSRLVGRQSRRVQGNTRRSATVKVCRSNLP